MLRWHETMSELEAAAEIERRGGWIAEGWREAIHVRAVHRDEDANLITLDFGGDPKALASAGAAIHPVGGAYQPLHCATRGTPEVPDGDRGGNLTFVRVGSAT